MILEAGVDAKNRTPKKLIPRCRRKIVHELTHGSKKPSKKVELALKSLYKDVIPK